MGCNGGFMAGSCPPGHAVKANLQDIPASVSALVLKGFAVSPRVGLPRFAGIALLRQQRRSLPGYETGTSLDAFTHGDVVPAAARLYGRLQVLRGLASARRIGWVGPEAPGR